MICPKCGRTIPDGTQCPCGAPVLSSNPAVNVIKTVGSSPKFLVATILYSAAIVLSILSTFSLTSIFNDAYYYAANFGTVDPEVFYPMMPMIESSSVASGIIASIPAILTAVGMWLFFISCRDTQSGNVSTAGLTICKVLAYIGLVAICLVGALIVILMIVLIVAIGAVGNNSYYYTDASAIAAAQMVFVFFIVLAAGVVALYIAFEVCVIKVINRVKASALVGTADNRIPRFLTGYMMVIGIVSGLGGLFSLITIPVAGLASLASAAAMIVMALVLGEYRSRMTMLLFPPVQPVYPQNTPPYNVPPQQPGGPTGGSPQQ